MLTSLPSIKIPREFLVGIGRILDISGSYSFELRRKYRTEESWTIDKDSLQKDWETVGSDLNSIHIANHKIASLRQHIMYQNEGSGESDSPQPPEACL